MRDIIGAPAGWLARAIRTKQVSSLEVVRAHLEHIHTVNPRLNAVVFATGESALKQARAADRRNKRKAVLGPLHGVPFTAKDIFDTEGLPTTAGLRMLRSNIPERDATVVARMRGAGAILIGKTLCPPGGAGDDSWNSLHGGTRNPYDIARSPGASSSGEAAIIAAGGSPAGLGSDSGGSIRMLPPESLPRPAGEPPAAMMAASPLLLAPGERAMSYGLRVPPWSEFQLSPSTPPGGQSVLPMRIAPAPRMRATTVASRSGMLLLSMRSPAVVGRPSVSKMSLAVKGTPCSGPSTAFLLFRRSAARACLSALSPVAKTTALSRGLTVWMCSRCARTTSSEETCLVRMARANQPAGAPIMSLISASTLRSAAYSRHRRPEPRRRRAREGAHRV